MRTPKLFKVVYESAKAKLQMFYILNFLYFGTIMNINFDSCDVMISISTEVECISDTTQKMKFFIKDFFSKCDQIRSFLRIWSHLLKKSLMETSIFEQCGYIF